MQLINSTVIRELSTIFFFPAAYIWGPISGMGGVGGYIRVLISGRLASWGLIYPGSYIPGAYIWGGYNRELISGGLLSRRLLSGGLYPGVLHPGGL